jgi:leucyl-tRNA synthetase
MGPLQEVKPWNTRGVEGVYRFLGRVWRLFVDEKSETDYELKTTVDAASEAAWVADIRLDPRLRDLPATAAQLKALHACIRKVTEDLDGLRFNTAISAMMMFINEAMTWETRPVSVLKIFLQLLAPFAPHLAEELWEKVHGLIGPSPIPSLTYSPWPAFDPALLVEDTLEIAVQVNGKVRDVIRVPAGATPADLEAAALAAEKAKPFLEGKTVRKIIVVPRKLVNIVVG